MIPKFRAWDISVNKYFQVTNINLPIDISNEPGLVALSHSHTIIEKYLIMEQWTGLEDESGKDIYEGDIVRKWHKNCETSDLSEPLIGYVKFHPEFARFCIQISKLHLISMYEQYSAYEVIGNIHENPGLVEEQTNE